MKRSFWFFLILACLATAGIIWNVVANLGMQLQPEELEQARKRWQELGPASYDLDLTEKLDGDREGDRFVISVRDGQVTKLVSNGRVVHLDTLSKEERDAYTVPGLFRRIEQDYNAEESSGERRYVISARFAAEYSYPALYVRKIRGSRSRLEWKVNLKVVEP